MITHAYKVMGMTCEGCVAEVKNQLEQHPEITSAIILLEKNLAKLTMDRHLGIDELQGFLGKNNKYKITAFNHDESEKIGNGVVSYKPLILIFLFITTITGITSINGEQADMMRWMAHFMAGFFIVFSFFKFLNLRAFAESYAMYDLLAKRIKAYGLIYPFIELALGIAYLTGFEPMITYATTIVVMGFSSIGVIQSVAGKKDIQCACLGTVFQLPMSMVTIIEDLMMVLMAAMMLWIT